MIGAIGDLVEDILVNLDSEIHHASDTPARIERRRGGSAATVAVVAAKLTGQSRFIGQVGADDVGTRVSAALTGQGVDHVGPSVGSTGTIVVLVDSDGERTMLTDQGDSAEVSNPDPAWLDGLSALHIPFYGLAKEPIGSTCRTLASWAAARGQVVSVDASSVSVLDEFGLARSVEVLQSIRPTVVFLNEDETSLFTGFLAPEPLTPSSLGARMLVCKAGPKPVVLLVADDDPIAVAVPESPLLAVAAGTTGAGDSFAAGFLTELVKTADPVAAVQSGHRAASVYLAF